MAASSTSPLRLGNAEQEPLEEILARGCADPILEAISLIGPHGLYTLLQRDTEAVRQFQPRRMYSNHRLRAVAERMESEFDVEPDRLRADLLRLVRELVDNGLLEIA